MNGYKIPLSLLKEKTYLADKYFSERFPTPTLEKTENPNFESSGCGVSMNATETEQSFNITDPSDSSKVLCEMIYSTEGIKFRYPNADMVNNVIDVGVGSNEKLDILSTDLSNMKNNFSLKYGGAYVITDEIGELNSICYGNGKFVAGAYQGNYCCYSTDGNTWTKSVINENASDAVWDICYGSGKFVAVADGYLMYSLNGINWTKAKDTDKNWSSVCYGNGMYLAIEKDTDNYAYSTDGINWTEGTIYARSSTLLRDICYGDGKFVAVEQYNFAYSEDGINWLYDKILDAASTIDWNFVCYGEDKFIATSEDSIYAYSYDGINWTQCTSDDEYLHSNIYCDNGKYVFGAENGFCKYSYDGILWKTVTDVPADMTIRGICNIPESDRFICVGSSILSVVIPNNYKKGIRSELAVTYNWTNAPKDALLPETATYYTNSKVIVDTYYASNVIYKEVPSVFNFEDYEWKELDGLSKYIIGDMDYMVLCYSDDLNLFVYLSPNSVLTSTDGINWTESTISNTRRDWRSVCYGNGKFVAVASSTNYFAYSNDGINWTESTITNTSRYWQSVCYGNDKFVAVVNGSNYFAYSNDGINWTESTISNTSRKWFSVCYGNGKFVAVAYSSNYFAYSNDGITWTESTISNTRRYWSSVCYGNDKFVAVADYDNYFAYSNDGITWTESTISNTSRYWQSVCYGNDKFVAVSTDDTNAVSNDGITWTESTISNTIRNWYSVCYGNDKFVAVVNGRNYFAYSNDGINWNTKFNPYIRGDHFFTTCHDLNMVLVLSSTGTIAYSNDGINWNTTIINLTRDNFFDDLYGFDSLCYGNGVFVAVTYERHEVIYSKDGINWEFGDLNYPSEENFDNEWPEDWTVGNTQKICYGNGLFIIYSDECSVISCSTDGINWNWVIPNIFDDSDSYCLLKNIYYYNGLFLATGRFKDPNHQLPDPDDEDINTYCVAYSENGINWNLSMPKYDTVGIASLTSQYLAYGDGKYVVGGYLYDENDDYAIFIAYSTDLINWEYTYRKYDSYDSEITGIVYGDGLFIANIDNENHSSGDGYAFAYSTDGINWNTVITDISTHYGSLTYFDGKFISSDAYDTTDSDSILYLDINNYYQFSGWDKTDFNITSDTNISGTWTNITELPENPVYINGKHNHSIIKTISYDLNVPSDAIETTTLDLPDDKIYISSHEGLNYNIAVDIPNISPVPSIIKGSGCYYTFDNFMSDDIIVNDSSN